MEDLTGRTFGEWRVLGYVGNKKYRCRCSCGKEKDVAVQSLRNGTSKSCGHKNQQDLTGMQFGDWKVLRYAGNKEWECQCSCGKIKNVRTYHLVSGDSTSCGHTNKRRNELTCQHFGDWEVLEYVGDRYYKCRCSCGVIKNVSSYSLTSGKSTSCGHDTGALKNEVGNKYGDLEVISYAGDKKWLCRCSCGKEVIALGKYLRSGKIVSCGHWKKEDLTNKQFGHWTVLSYAGNLSWNCRCSCGKERAVLARALKNGSSRSCGCGGKDVASNYREKMLVNHNEISSTRLNNPRETWQIETVTNPDKMKQFLIDFYTKNSRKPRLVELEKLLNTTFSTLAKAIHKYKLEELIDIYSETSEKEKELLTFVESQYSGKIISNTRSIIPPLEIDIYLPELNLGIEFNGTYWHSELVKDRMYHFNKSKLCNSKGVRLIHIFEYEWDSNRELIKYYLTGILKSNNKIYARDTYIREVDLEEAKEFINKYHLQGYANSDIRIGIYKDNLLLGIMTFGNPRFNQNYEYEIIRLVWSPGYSVVGGSEKLFKYFIDKYKPKSIISYCDISKFTGDVYFKLGFKLNSVSNPGYVWIDRSGNLLNRYTTMKQKLVDSNLGSTEQSESDIMHDLGYFRIYNCGNAVFSWYSQEERVQ